MSSAGEQPSRRSMVVVNVAHKAMYKIVQCIERDKYKDKYSVSFHLYVDVESLHVELTFRSADGEETSITHVWDIQLLLDMRESALDAVDRKTCTMMGDLASE